MWVLIFKIVGMKAQLSKVKQFWLPKLTKLKHTSTQKQYPSGDDILTLQEPIKHSQKYCAIENSYTL